MTTQNLFYYLVVTRLKEPNYGIGLPIPDPPAAPEARQFALQVTNSGSKHRLQLSNIL